MKNIIPQKAEKQHNNFSAVGEWIPTKGEQVRACTASGAILTRRVWEVGDKVVYLCSDRCYRELQVGARLKPAIGFPKRDVFRIAEVTTEN